MYTRCYITSYIVHTCTIMHLPFNLQKNYIRAKRDWKKIGWANTGKEKWWLGFSAGIQVDRLVIVLSDCASWFIPSNRRCAGTVTRCISTGDERNRRAPRRNFRYVRLKLAPWETRKTVAAYRLREQIPDCFAPCHLDRAITSPSTRFLLLSCPRHRNIETNFRWILSKWAADILYGRTSSVLEDESVQ